MLSAAVAHGDDERPPLPESILTESATDVDATERGELEIEGNVASLGARRGGAHTTVTSLEAEWRVLRPVGVRVEPSFAHTTSRDIVGIGGALAFGLFHDFAHDAHLQLEILGRVPRDADAARFEPSESELPAAADLVGALRRDRFTLRATVGGEAGAAPAHAPLHTDFALLTGILPEERFGFVVIEARFDWARRAPCVLAPEVVADLTSLGVPLRIGVALPWNVGADDATESFGFFTRVILLTSREAAYGRGP
jgi:hypothetical protein